MPNEITDRMTVAEPTDAAAVILLDPSREKVLWAKRNPQLKFLGGFHGFPGGKLDTDDRRCRVENAAAGLRPELVACAVREVFEEIGVLLVRKGEKLTAGQRASLHDDLVSGRFEFSEILDTWGLWIDASDFEYCGFWTTPEFSPMRYKTRFFIAECPFKQTPYAAIGELRDIEFIEPQTALDRWAASKVLIAPPVLISLRALRDDPLDPGTALRRLSDGCGGNLDQIELNSRITCVPLRTKTLPPATHTNCFIVGGKDFVVIDAAARESTEIQKLTGIVDSMISKGANCRAIILSHLHRDHFGGEIVLKDHLLRKFGINIPIAAHPLTAESLAGQIDFDELITDEQTFNLADAYGRTFLLTALHTPGHARGHLCFYDEDLGFLLSSDNVVGAGTVVIAPPEGNMTDYLNSLERMKNLPSLNFLCGSHGAANADAVAKIQEYIDHRKSRELQIIEAMRNGADSAEEIVDAVYQGLAPALLPLAVETVRAHLSKIRNDIAGAI